MSVGQELRKQRDQSVKGVGPSFRSRHFQKECCQTHKMADDGEGSSLPDCLPLSSPALNDTIDFILSGFLPGCQPLQYGSDLREYLYNKPADGTTTSVTFHYTGSRAEGIDRASDDDFMFVNHDLRVINNSVKTVEKDKENLSLIAIHVRPGYVHLRCDSLEHKLSEWLKLKENDGFFRSDVLKAYMLNSDQEGSENDEFFNHLTEHGPALTDEKENEDFVCALPCYEWPEIAMEFTTRVRKSNQPSSDIIEKIVSQGCLYVGVGHHHSADRGKEWRMSFSLAEKILVRSWNDVKTKCYIAVKALCKENLDTEPNVICSYFIKTAIFWLSERMPDSFWKEGTILDCVSAVMTELLSYTTTGTCPNYFVPSNNMMDHLSHEQRTDVASKIESMMNDLPLALLQSKLADATFKKSADFVTLYLVLKNSDSPSNAETQLSLINSHNKPSRFKHYENYYESMHLTEILRDFKGFFFQRLHSGIDIISQMVMGDLPTVITNLSFKCAYEKLLCLALGDIYQQMASSKCDLSAEEQHELLTQAESWISKAGILKHPSGFEDGGILTSACKALLYYTSGDKEKALDLCSQECDRVYSDVQHLHDLCHWSCAVTISSNEAQKFSQVDSSIVALLGDKDLHASPVSIMLYIAIKCCRSEDQQRKLYECFEQLQQWFPPEITYHEKELHRSHTLLKNILTQDGILQVTGNLSHLKFDEQNLEK